MEIKAQFVKDLCGGGIEGEKTVSKLETVLMSGQWPRGMTRHARRVFFCNYLLIPGADTGNQRGSFARCDGRRRALPYEPAAF